MAEELQLGLGVVPGFVSSFFLPYTVTSEQKGHGLKAEMAGEPRTHLFVNLDDPDGV